MRKKKNTRLLNFIWEAGFTIEKFSQVVNLSRVTVDRMVNCRGIPSERTAKIIADYFNCEVGYLFESVFSNKPNYKLVKTKRKTKKEC